MSGSAIRFIVAGAVAASGTASLAGGNLPDVPAIQLAYEAAYIATRGKPPGEHADDLVIQAARCQPFRQGGAACQIDFVREREPEGRLYADVVTLEPDNGTWALRSGLCMTKAADRHAAAARAAAVR